MLLPPVNAQGSFFLGQLFSPPRIQALPLLPIGPLSDLAFHPDLLQHQVLAFHFLPILCRHGVVATRSLHTLMLFKGLVLARGLETSDAVVVPLTVTGPHLLNAVHGRILSSSIPPVAFQRLCSVPPLLFSWRIHGPARSTVPSTRRPTHVIFGACRGSAWSAWPRLDGFAAVGQSGPGFDGNSHG